MWVECLSAYYEMTRNSVILLLTSFLGHLKVFSRFNRQIFSMLVHPFEIIDLANRSLNARWLHCHLVFDTAPSTDRHPKLAFPKSSD